MISADVTPQEWAVVTDILKKNLSPGAHVWVFGSRAQHTAKRYSDLDLAIDMKRSLAYETLVNLKHDFDESSLRFKVDIVDWHAIDADFRKRVVIHNTPENSWDFI